MTEYAHREFGGYMVDGVTRLGFRDEVFNLSGISPTEFKVLILPKPVEEKKGSILLPEMTKEQDKWATMEGTLVAASPLAFTYAKADEWREVNAAPPKPGDRVLFAKYAGVHVKGRDGADYVLANDKDVMAVMAD